MYKVVQYKINRIPCQILLRFVFVSVSSLSFYFFFCLFVGFFLLLACFTRDVWQPLTQIRLSLSLSLGVGQIVFLAGINATENTVSVVYLYMVYLLFRGQTDSLLKIIWKSYKTFFSLSQALCVLTAAFLQYFLMVAFCWMLVEEIYFVLFVVKVYNIGTKMHMYHFISWGIVISLVVNYCKLLNRKYDFSSCTNFILLMFRFAHHHG